MLEERALTCKQTFESAQKLAKASAKTASRTDLMRQQANTTSTETRTSSTERADEGINDSEGSYGRVGRRRNRNRTKNGNHNLAEPATTDFSSSRRARKSPSPEVRAESDDSGRGIGRVGRRRNGNQKENGNAYPEAVTPGSPSSQRSRKSASSAEMAEVGIVDSESGTGGVGRRRKPNGTSRGNQNPETVTPGSPSSQKARKSTRAEKKGGNRRVPGNRLQGTTVAHMLPCRLPQK